jgi:uncharacterized protein (TIGR02611 family)
MKSKISKDIKQIKKLIIFVFGFTLLTIGLVLLFLPGPGIPIIILGLIVLATEFLWARRLLRKAKQYTKKITK